ncbi:MAG: T9SS type A sorting domain-containing protein [Bacteroidota bacterium]
MKNRFLPFSLITTFLGLSLVVFSVLSLAGQPGNPDLRKIEGSWWESIRANQHSGVVSPQDVVTARQQAEALRYKSTSAMNLNWISVGPGNFPGQSWSAIFDNTDPNGMTMIAGSANGGIWKSTDLGLTWVQMQVSDNLVPKVASIVQSSNGTIYAATGVTTCKLTDYNGTGIYRSTANGAFAPIPGTLGNPDFYGVTKLAINQQTGRIFAATSGGLYYSDNGDIWVKALSGFAMDVVVGSDGTVLMAVGDSAYLAPLGDLNSKVTLTTGNNNALPKGGIGWMVFAIAPSDINVMYASIADPAGKLLNIYTSSDKGATWSIVFPNNPTFEPFGTGFGCYSNTLAVSPTDPTKVYLGGLNMWFGQRVQSTGYYNWEQVSFGSHGALSPYLVPLYHHCYIFRPNHAEQFVIASDGGISLATIGQTDLTFQTSNKNLQTSQFNTLAFSAQKGYVMGGGKRIGTLAMGFFAPSQTSFPNDGYQVWRQDASALGPNSQPQPSNYCGDGGTCEWSSVDSRVAVYTKVGTLRIRRQDLTDINYVNTFFQKGVNAVSSTRMPMRLWETFNQGKVFGITRDSVKFHAEQKAIPADTTIMIRSASNNFLFPYYTTAPIPKGDSIIVGDPIASRFFIFGDTTLSTINYKAIYMTKDMLKLSKVPEYFMIFRDFASNDLISCLALSSDLNTLWAGTAKGRLIRVSGIVNAYDSATANISSSQCVLVDTVFSNTPFTGRNVTSISIDPSNSNRVLVTLGNYGNTNYVYYAQNGNAPAPLFTSIQGSLPQAPVYSGLIEMHGNSAVLGTDLGAFTTSNLNSGAPQWAPEMQNIGFVPVTDVRQQVMYDYHILNYGVIYISTYGRGVWMDTTYYSPVGIDPGPGVIATNGNLSLNPNPVKDNLRISYTNETTGNLSLLVYDLTGHVVLSSTFGNQPKGTFTTTINVSGLANGSYIVKIGNGYGKIVKM